jgi:hypothetical protein
LSTPYRERTRERRRRKKLPQPEMIRAAVLVSLLGLVPVISAQQTTGSLPVTDLENKCDICKNGGELKLGSDSITCSCPPMFSGTYCDKSSCQNGGVAKQIVGDGLLCVCPDGYYGKFCENEQDNCCKKPCQNGGTCTSTPTSYSCQCPVGYSGKSCELRTCNVTLQSWGWLDVAKSGGITINGAKVFDNSAKAGPPQYVVLIAIFNYPNCSISNAQYLDVNGWNNFANSQPNGTILIGVTADTYIWPPDNSNKAFYGASPTIQKLGGPDYSKDTTVAYASKMQYIFQIGSPSKTYFETAPPKGANIVANFVFTGKSAADVAITKV